MKLALSALMAAIALIGSPFGTLTQARGDVFTFEVQPDQSRVDMTLFSVLYFLSPTGTVRGTADTQTMPITGTLVLDVDIDDGAVASVDFVSLEWWYEVGLDDPVTFETRTLQYNSLEQLNGGSAQNVRLPFDTNVAVGNPVPVLAPRLAIEAGAAGTESGAGGNLRLEGSTYEFEGTGQYFFPELDRSAYPLRDGFPILLGPYPQAVDFPSDIPLSVVTDENGNVVLTDADGDGNGDAIIDQTMPAPTGPNFLDGSVTLSGSVLTFEADFLSYGVGGAGLGKSAMIHEGSVVATTVVPEPSSLAMLSLAGLALIRRRHRRGGVLDV